MKSDGPADLDPYYESELSYYRGALDKFISAHPTAAQRLQLYQNECRDPHVERMIQATALLTGRIQRKIDTELPEIAIALLGAVYPHFLGPMPPIGVVQFALDPGRGPSHEISRHTKLVAVDATTGVHCRFRTSYPVKLFPIEVENANLFLPSELQLQTTAAKVIRIQLRTQEKGATFGSLGISSLRFYLPGTSGFAIYDALMRLDAQDVSTQTSGRVCVRTAENPQQLVDVELHPVGFSEDEGLLPDVPRSSLGYRLLQEYFAFPEKFLFIDVNGLDRLPGAAHCEQIELLFVLPVAPPQSLDIDASSFALGCTPFVNLFGDQHAEAIQLNQRQYEHQIKPGRSRNGRGYEVFSVDQVRMLRPEADGPELLRPVYSLGNRSKGRGAYWLAVPRFEQWLERDDATDSSSQAKREPNPRFEVFLSVVDPNLDKYDAPTDATLDVTLTCTNCNLAEQLTWPDCLELELGGGELLTKIHGLLTPRPARRMRPERDGLWRLISHLSLSFLSLAQVSVGKTAADNDREKFPFGTEHMRDEAAGPLREMLRLYAYLDEDTAERQIAGVQGMFVQPTVACPESVGVFCRGLRIHLFLNESSFSTRSVVLFASVLEKFFGLHASINSFTELVLHNKQGKEVKRWMPRSGLQPLK